MNFTSNFSGKQLPSLNELEVELDKRACARSFAQFVRRGWHVLEPGTKLAWGWSLDAICEHLEAVTAGQISRLLMNVPPGCMKSLLTGVFWPAWEWGPMDLAHNKFLGTSHKQDLAIRDNRKCRLLIESRWYQERWPVKLVNDQNEKKKFENDRMGFREAMAFTSMTGSRGDRVLLDDPHSVDDGNSEAELYAAELTFTEALPSRVNNEHSAIVVIMQRIHESDVSGIITSRDIGYEHLMLPMRFEIERRCTTSVGFKDPRKEDGELLFPERFPAYRVDADEKIMGAYAVAGQMQQRPAPREGGMFKKEWFRKIYAAPPGTFWVRGWDLAGSTDQRAAFTAGVLIGLTPDRRVVIGDAKRERLTPGGVKKFISRVARQDVADGYNPIISIPQDPAQAGKAQKMSFAQDLLEYEVRFSPESGEKEVRAAPLSAAAENGLVDYVEGSWNHDFFEEISIFPAGKFKDQTDAASRAYMEIMKRAGRANETLGSAPKVIDNGE